MSQGELGRAADLSYQQVGNYEKGRVKNLQPQRIAAMALKLNEKPEDYLALAGLPMWKAEGIVPIEPSALPPLSAIEEVVRSVLRDEMKDLGEVVSRAVVVALKAGCPDPEGRAGSTGQRGSGAPHRGRAV